MTLDDRQRARLHESGHAIIGHVLGQESVHVVAFGGHGYTRHRLPSDRQTDGMSTAEFRSFMEAIAVSQLSGEAALEVFGDPDPRQGADSDRAKALKVAQFLNPSAPAAELDRLYGRAVAHARQHRLAIERLAETLRLNHDRLAGEEVTDATGAALAGWPSPIFGPERDFAIMVERRALFERAMADGASSPAIASILARREARAQVDRGDRFAVPASSTNELRRGAPLAARYVRETTAFGQIPTVAGLYAFAGWPVDRPTSFLQLPSLISGAHAQLRKETP